jgi:hypothetical protein
VLHVEVAPQVVAHALGAEVRLPVHQRPIRDLVGIQGGDGIDVLGGPGPLPRLCPAPGGELCVHDRRR